MDSVWDIWMVWDTIISLFQHFFHSPLLCTQVCFLVLLGFQLMASFKWFHLSIIKRDWFAFLTKRSSLLLFSVLERSFQPSFFTSFPLQVMNPLSTIVKTK